MPTKEWGYLIKVGYSSVEPPQRFDQVSKFITGWQKKYEYPKIEASISELPQALSVPITPCHYETTVRYKFGYPLSKIIANDLDLPVPTEWVLCDTNHWKDLFKNYQRLSLLKGGVDAHNIFKIPIEAKQGGDYNYIHSCLFYYL